MVPYFDASDLVKSRIEMYTILLFLLKHGVKGATLQVCFLSMFSPGFLKVNVGALNIKSYQPWQKICRGSAEAHCIFI